MNQYAKKMASYVKPGSFLRNFFILGSGTALSQIVPVLASPILTRIYTPQDFAMFAVFMALIGMFTPIVCGKYEVALVLPKSHIQARHLLGIAICFSVAVSGLLTTIFLFAGNNILALLNANRLGVWLNVVPMGLLLTGIFTALNYYANRYGDYRLMSRARIFRSLFTVLCSVAAGIVGAGFAGMLVGFFAGMLVAVIILTYEQWKMFDARVWVFGKAKKWLFCKYRQYPVYNATSGLLDGLTLSLPVLVLSHYYSEDIVGYFALVSRVLAAPVGFVSASVSQVNLKKIVDIVNNRESPLQYLYKVSALLLSIIFLPACVIIGWGPTLFGELFGQQWIIAGEYARILMPAFMIQFVASTLSSTLGATQNNRLGAIWKVFSLLSTAAVCYLFAPKDDAEFLIYAFSVNNIVLYLLYLAAVFYAAMNPRRD